MIVGYTDIRELTRGEMDLLPDDERSHEFGSESRRRQFQCGRALVRLMLQQTTGRMAAEHIFSTEKGGKPICVDGPAISITHTDRVVACCVARSGLAGIDVERIDEDRDISQIVRRFFSPEEAEWLDTSADGFYMLWVLKEAFVKAHGQSIFGGLEKLRCLVEPPVIHATAIEGGYRALGLYRRDDILLGLATTEDELQDVEFRYWTPQTGEIIAGDDFRLVAMTNTDS